jgi:hypothetical protein
VGEGVIVVLVGISGGVAEMVRTGVTEGVGSGVVPVRAMVV